MISVGSKAPEFKLKDQNGKSVKLSLIKGKRILLSFRPLAWTPVWSKQMKSLEENYTQFDKLNAKVVGIGVDSVPCNKAWAKSLDIIKVTLLSDFWPHGEAAQLYDVFRSKDGFSQRANILIDENHIVKFVKVYPLNQLPDINEILEVLLNTKDNQ